MPSAALGRRYPRLVQLIRQRPVRREASGLELTNDREQSTVARLCSSFTRCSTAYSSPAGRGFPYRSIGQSWPHFLAAALFQSEHLRPRKAPMSALAPAEREQLMEPSKTGNRSAFVQARERRDRSTAGWADTVATGAQRQEGRPMRRTPTAVSGVWLFLLSSVLRRNGLLSLHLWSRHKPPAGQR